MSLRVIPAHVTTLRQYLSAAEYYCDSPSAALCIASACYVNTIPLRHKIY